MLAVIAIVLIVLWLLGFFAFHVTSAFIHVALVVGLILLVLHFMRDAAKQPCRKAGNGRDASLCVFARLAEALLTRAGQHSRERY